MTPLPAVLPRRRVQAYIGTAPIPPRGLVCAEPGCGKAASQRHHIVGRGALLRPYNYVVIDRKIVAVNVADLCQQSHNNVEDAPGGYKARILWTGAGWGWYRKPTPDELLHEEREFIWWNDPKTQAAWIFKGFLKMEWRPTFTI